MQTKILKLEQVSIYLDKIKKTKILASGCFDILHIGHIRYLAAAKKIADLCIVTLESDEFINIYKERKPFHPISVRAEILSHLDIVDYIILLPFLHSSSQYLEAWKKIKPNYIAVTRQDPYIENKRKQAEQIGAQVKIVLPLIKHISTSRILTITKKEEYDLSQVE